MQQSETTTTRFPLRHDEFAHIALPPSAPRYTAATHPAKRATRHQPDTTTTTEFERGAPAPATTEPFVPGGVSDTTHEFRRVHAATMRAAEGAALRVLHQAARPAAASGLATHGASALTPVSSDSPSAVSAGSDVDDEECFDGSGWGRGGGGGGDGGGAAAPAAAEQSALVGESKAYVEAFKRDVSSGAFASEFAAVAGETTHSNTNKRKRKRRKKRLDNVAYHSNVVAISAMYPLEFVLTWTSASHRETGKDREGEHIVDKWEGELSEALTGALGVGDEGRDNDCPVCMESIQNPIVTLCCTTLTCAHCTLRWVNQGRTNASGDAIASQCAICGNADDIGNAGNWNMYVRKEHVEKLMAEVERCDAGLQAARAAQEHARAEAKEKVEARSAARAALKTASRERRRARAIRRESYRRQQEERGAAAERERVYQRALEQQARALASCAPQHHAPQHAARASAPITTAQLAQLLGTAAPVQPITGQLDTVERDLFGFISEFAPPDSGWDKLFQQRPDGVICVAGGDVATKAMLLNAKREIQMQQERRMQDMQRERLARESELQAALTSHRGAMSAPAPTATAATAAPNSPTRRLLPLLRTLRRSSGVKRRRRCQMWGTVAIVTATTCSI